MTVLVNVKKKLKYLSLCRQSKFTQVYLKWQSLLIEVEKLKIRFCISPILTSKYVFKYIHTHQFKQMSYNLYKDTLGNHFFKGIHCNDKGHSYPFNYQWLIIQEV